MKREVNVGKILSSKCWKEVQILQNSAVLFFEPAFFLAGGLIRVLFSSVSDVCEVRRHILILDLRNYSVL